MKRIFSNSVRALNVAGAALGLVLSSTCSTSATTDPIRVKMCQQTEEAVIRALIRAGVTSEKMVLPPSSSTLPEPAQSDALSVTEVMGFTGNDLQTGGTIKTRLEHITATLLDHVSSADELRARIEQIDCERKRDMNFFVAQMNALHTELQFLTALTITTEIMNQELIDQSPLSEEELRVYIQNRTESVLNALPKQETLSPLYLCCCVEKPDPEQKVCPCCGSTACSCLQDKTEPTTPPEGGNETEQPPAGDGNTEPLPGNGGNTEPLPGGDENQTPEGNDEIEDPDPFLDANDDPLLQEVGDDEDLVLDDELDPQP